MSALADYISAWSTSENPAFTPAFDAVVAALDAGDTVLEYGEALSPDGKLVVDLADARQGKAAPLVQKGHYLWLHRIWQKEYQLAQALMRRAAEQTTATVAPDTAIIEGLLPEQKQALWHSLTHRLSIINGGPGTGKTFTLARIVLAQLKANPHLRIALAAPTGKAANRMSEALNQEFTRVAGESENAVNALDEAKTLHRLLGLGANRVPRFNAQNPLPYQLVIVDEASMLSLELAHALLQALSEDTTLILLGDANQLAAVDPGAVLHDISQQASLKDAVITLRAAQRFAAHSGIGQLAAAVRDYQEKDDIALTTILTQSPDIHWQDKASSKTYDDLYAPFADYLDALKSQATADELLEAFNRYRILCAGHYGALGVTAVNEQMKYRHLLALNRSIDATVYLGMPIMMLANDYENHLFNGDIGICLEAEAGHFAAYFGEGKTLPLARLSWENLVLSYALTIHKSQGSEFQRVALALDARQEKGMSRELLYTGITRAKAQLDIYAQRRQIEAALMTPTERSTGLSFFLK